VIKFNDLTKHMDIKNINFNEIKIYLRELGRFVLVVSGDLDDRVTGLQCPAVHDLFDGSASGGGGLVLGVCSEKIQCVSARPFLGWRFLANLSRGHLDGIRHFWKSGAGGGGAFERRGAFSCGAAFCYDIASHLSIISSVTNNLHAQFCL